jgi:hypothetical protein
MTFNNYRWKKAGDINREYALFELLADNIPILDVGFSDAGVLEVAFNSSIAGLIIEREALSRARSLKTRRT